MQTTAQQPIVATSPTNVLLLPEVAITVFSFVPKLEQIDLFWTCKAWHAICRASLMQGKIKIVSVPMAKEPLVNANTLHAHFFPHLLAQEMREILPCFLDTYSTIMTPLEAVQNFVSCYLASTDKKVQRLWVTVLKKWVLVLYEELPQVADVLIPFVWQQCAQTSKDCDQLAFAWFDLQLEVVRCIQKYQTKFPAIVTMPNDTSVPTMWQYTHQQLAEQYMYLFYDMYKMISPYSLCCDRWKQTGVMFHLNSSRNVLCEMVVQQIVASDTKAKRSNIMNMWTQLAWVRIRTLILLWQ